MTRYGWLFWFPLLATILIVAYEILLFRKNRMFKRKKKDSSAKIAHTKFVRNLPEYKKARKRYNMMLILSAILYVAAGGALTYLSARPVFVTESKEEKENRDIMFCLDVSGSMDIYIEDLADSFISLVKQMNGERFGITVFDGEYAVLSPLSDDYSALLDVLKELEDTRSFSKISGAMRKVGRANTGSSEIGAGLIGCADSFDRLDEVQRSRIIILATDNLGPTKPIATLVQAAYYAKERDITVYGFNISDTNKQEDIDNNKVPYQSASEKEFQQATLITGGSYYALSKSSGYSSKKIIDQIMAQEAARYEGAGQLVRTDVPQIAAIVSSILLVLLMIIIWRLYL